MLTNLLFLALSAVSIVSGSPLQEPFAACGIAVAGSCVPEMYPGLYIISQGLKELRNGPAGDPLKLVFPPRGPAPGYTQLWWVEKVGEDQFHLRDYHSKALAARDVNGDMVISSHLTTPALSVWAIESASNSDWTHPVVNQFFQIKLPGKDATWKTRQDGKTCPQIHIRRADGSAEERWEFEYLEGIL
ncbi:hypothetical protein C8R43DRAFT_964772 [Mycena crocata]|nr:hypothetical protein C8R43DRAFT_964772 [Mycena crocata]